ncbi:MAG: hypothetical protein ACI4R6_08085, partial [Lachnospiraceae bacterium]
MNNFKKDTKNTDSTADKVNPMYKGTAYFCMGLLFLMLIFIILRIAVKNVMYEKLGIYNSVVAFFLEGDNDVTADEDNSRPVNINWAEIYPYDEKDLYVAADSKKSLLDRYTGIVGKIESQAEWYTTDGLPMQTKLTELAAGYESLIGWKVQEQDYDAVITLRNGHLTCVCPKQDVEEIVDSITQFRDFLSEMDIKLMYVMVPFKVDRDNDMLPLG